MTDELADKILVKRIEQLEDWMGKTRAWLAEAKLANIPGATATAWFTGDGLGLARPFSVVQTETILLRAYLAALRGHEVIPGAP